MIKEVLLVILGALVGALASYWLPKHPARLDKNRAIILGLVNSTRALPPTITTRVNQGYLFPNDLTPIRKLHHESETQASYFNLPRKTKKLITGMLRDVDQFSLVFVRFKDAIYPFFGNLPNPRGVGSATEFVATAVVCMQESEIPTTPLKVNFPRDSSGHVSQANLTAGQVRALWKFGQEKAPVEEFRTSQRRAKEAIAALDCELARLQQS